MKKILDFVLIFLVIFLTISLFSNKEEKTSELTFKPSDNNYSIPVSLVLVATNNTPENVSFNTCEDISLTYSKDKISLPEEFCKDIVLNSWEKKEIDYSMYYELFDRTWNYIFEVNVDWERSLSQFEVWYRWSFSKIFITLFYWPIYNLIIYLLSLFSWSLWWSIITITILIRLLLLWPQNKMMLSQRKLQAIQPKIKAIQEKYKWQQQLLWTELMKLYKEEKVNPMGSCWFLIIQMPILIVMYHVIMSINDHTNYYYIYDYLKSFDLTSISYNFLWIDLLLAWWIQWLILAISIAVIQFIQVKLSLTFKKKTDTVVLEKKKWDDKYSQFMPDPEMMNKFMLYWMPAMVWVFTYTLLAWIWLYWWISTLFMIFQQLYINKIHKM